MPAGGLGALPFRPSFLALSRHARVPCPSRVAANFTGMLNVLNDATY